jgi:plastocyanin
MRRLSLNTLLLVAFFALFAGLAHAEDTVMEEHLILLNHMFDPQELDVPAGKKIKLIITNKDASGAEFESADLNREKVVPANGEIYVTLGPLDPGTYGFYDDFHHTTTTGKIVAK